MRTCINILLALLLCYRTINAANGDKNRKTICGKVVDKATGESLAGVKIKVQGSDTFCYSDLSGNYVLSISAEVKPEIVVEGLGYQRSTIKSDELGFNIDINLTPLQ
jgi:hypothetical protein